MSNIFEFKKEKNIAVHRLICDFLETKEDINLNGSNYAKLYAEYSYWCGLNGIEHELMDKTTFFEEVIWIKKQIRKGVKDG